MRTSVAQCAQAIRVDLKENFKGVKFSVQSHDYSGGDSVRVRWFDGPTEEEVEKHLSKYEYGHFNGMEDIYEYTNVINGLPQTKYLFCNREMSPETRQNLLPQAEKVYSGFCEDTRRNLCGVESFLRKLLRKTPMKAGEVGREIVHTDVTAGLIEDFYTIKA